MTAALFAVTDEKTFTITSHDAYENYMSMDPGYSSARNILDPGGDSDFQNIFLKLKSMLIKTPQTIEYKFSQEPSDVIKEIDIIISFLNYEKILNDRAKAIQIGFLKNPTEVPAEIVFEGKKYKAKTRLKGDLGDHWLGNKRLSLRVRLKNGETIFGINKFSIHKPRARQYPYEHAFQNSLRQAGNIGAIHDFAKITVNGEAWGVMNVEENISKQFLEKEKLKDSLVFRFSDDKKWLQYDRSFSNAYSEYRFSDPRLIATVAKQNKYLDDDLWRSQYTYVLERRLEKQHPELYAIEPHLRAFFASLLWNNQHTLSNSNSRYYLNPYLLQLEPITTDQGMFIEFSEDLESVLDKIYLTETYKQVFSGSKKHELEKYSANSNILDLDDVETQLNKFKNYFPLDMYKETAVLSKNSNLIEKNKQVIFDWISGIKIQNTSEDLAVSMPSDLQASYFQDHVHVRHYDDGKILLFNLLPDAINIDRVVFDDGLVIAGGFSIPGFGSGEYDPYVLQTQLMGYQDEKIRVHSSYKGNQRSILAYPTMVSKGIYNPLIKRTMEETPPFVHRVDDFWEIIPGDWVVKQPLIVDGDLRINQGTNLKFLPESYLIVKGSLNIIGSELSPVTMDAVDGGWKGIYVISQGGSETIFKSVIIKNTTGLNDGLLALTGGVNIYGGAVVISDLALEKSSAEDALNIINAKIQIEKLTVRGSVSDGFDCDYCTGQINASSFEEVGGDGLDFSGSEVELVMLSFKNVKDKGVSVGEASSISIKNSYIQSVGVGIAVKDGSSATAENVVIEDYKLFGAMTYSKKNHYSQFSSLEMIGSTIGGLNPFLRQDGTLLIADDKAVLSREVDVDELYSSGVMKK
ncbi:hypothetical protein N9384_00380 [bacterium]|nr:hypothetical protein [bacterium]